MSRTFKQRILAVCATMVGAAALGVVAGYFLGRAIALHLAEGHLCQFASSVVAEGDASAAAARRMLASMHASPYPFCSDAQINQFRRQILGSDEMKDAGRIRDGKIICSTTLGRLPVPFPLPRPNFTQPDGTEVYWNLPPFHLSERGVVSLVLGDSYVIYGSHERHSGRPFTPPYTVAIVDTSGQPVVCRQGSWSQNVDPSRTHNGQGRRGDSLYATRCSEHYFNCISASLPISAILRAEQGHLLASTFLGGLTGIGFGLACSLLYWRSRSLEQQLRRAIRRNQLRTVYQPIVDLASGRIVGAETLARWRDEEGLEISPDLFVRIAEENGFVGQITALVTRHALQDFAGTLHTHPGFRLSLNVAAADLADPHLLPMLEQELERARVEPRSVAIEITERSTIERETVTETIQSLRQRGHSVHIDDFGTGYSSLAYLHELSVDAIKIDKAFTRSIGTEAVTVAILPQILAMARALNLEVIVEGIETEQQTSYFIGLNFPVLAQGWFFGRPVAADEFHRRLAANERGRFTATGTD
ncbi:MAG: EAL domain-containing protein [Terracidiphilus sp.]